MMLCPNLYSRFTLLAHNFAGLEQNDKLRNINFKFKCSNLWRPGCIIFPHKTEVRFALQYVWQGFSVWTCEKTKSVGIITQFNLNTRHNNYPVLPTSFKPFTLCLHTPPYLLTPPYTPLCLPIHLFVSLFTSSSLNTPVCLTYTPLHLPIHLLWHSHSSYDKLQIHPNVLLWLQWHFTPVMVFTQSPDTIPQWHDWYRIRWLTTGGTRSLT